MWRLVVVSLVTAGSLVGLPTWVAASCAGPFGPDGATNIRARLAEAPVTFVGTVVSTSNHERVARVQVESVWKGHSIPERVTVSGTPDQSSAATSVDRTFAPGQRYLFAPSSSRSPFQDNACTATQPWSSQLAPLKPVTSAVPIPGSDGLDPSGLVGAPGWALAGVAAAVVVVVATGLLGRAGRLRRWAGPDRTEPLHPGQS